MQWISSCRKQTADSVPQGAAGILLDPQSGSSGALWLIIYPLSSSHCWLGSLGNHYSRRSVPTSHWIHPSCKTGALAVCVHPRQVPQNLRRRDERECKMLLIGLDAHRGQKFKCWKRDTGGWMHRRDRTYIGEVCLTLFWHCWLCSAHTGPLQ